MTNVSPAAEAVSRTVWVLATLRGYSSKQELAKAMGWDRTRLSRTLSGARQWTLEDLVTVAGVLGLSNAGELFRPLNELVGAIHPAAEGGVSRGVSARYLGTNGASVLPFPQARASRWRYLTAYPHVDTDSDQSASGHSLPLTVISDRTITNVTTAVGI